MLPWAIKKNAAPSNEITDIWEFSRNKYINKKIRNIKEDLVRKMQFSWYVTAVCEIMTEFLIVIRWRKLFNSSIVWIG